jgi:hypothetical protein
MFDGLFEGVPSKDKPLTKVVGRRKPARVDVGSFDSMQKMVNALRAGRGLVPKGVYRFHTFEEADAWLIRTMAENSSRASRR